MIHYTCDCCQRPIDPESEMRYVVRLEVYASLESNDDELSDDRDYLQEVQDILERLDHERNEEIRDEVCQQQRFDLCDECRRRFVKNPLGKPVSHHLNFSQN